MKKQNTILLVFLLILACKDDLPPISLDVDNIFSKDVFQIFDNSVSSAREILKLPNQEYIILGDNDNGSINLMKFNKQLKLIWENEFSADNNNLSYQLLQTFDGGLAIIGTTGSPGNRPNEPYIIKTDSEGQALWSKVISSNSHHNARSFIQTTDNGFIILSTKNKENTFDSDILILKIDQYGEEVWRKIIDESFDDEAFSIIETQENHFLFLRTTPNRNGLVKDLSIVNIDMDGNIISEKWIGEIDKFARPNKIIKLQDSGFLIGTVKNNEGTSGKDINLIRLDKDGNVIWSKEYGGNRYDVFNNLIQTKDGGFAFLGHGSSYSDDSHFYLFKLDANGNKIWNNIYGGKQFALGNTLVEKDAGGFIIGGTLEGDDANIDFDMILVETDEFGIPQ